MAEDMESKAKGAGYQASPPDAPDTEKKPAFSRRNFVALALAGAAAMLIGPRLYWAGYPPASAEHGTSGGYSEGSCLSKGQAVWASSPFWGWQCGYNQYIRMATSLEVDCDYKNELYTHIVYSAWYACGDDNWQNSSRLWFATPGGDHYYGYWGAGTDQPTYTDGFDALNLELASGMGSGYNTQWKCDHSMDFFIRRQKGQVGYGAGLTMGVYHVSVGAGAVSSGTYGNPWTTWATSVDCAGDISYAVDAIGLKNRWDLFGMIAKVVPDGHEGMCLDAAGGGTSSGTGMWLWEYYHQTSQNWCVLAGPVDDTGDGHLHLFAGVHVPGLACVAYDDGASGPTLSAWRDCYLHSDDDTSACFMWVHDYAGCDYITCDADGLVLDRFNTGTENGTDVHYHSSGDCPEWTNQAHKWHVREVLFEGSAALEGLVGGEVDCEAGASCSDPRSTCRPKDGFSTGSVSYMYRWYVSDSPDDSPADDSALLVGNWKRHSWTAVERDIPTHQYLGLACEDQVLTDFNASLRDCPYSGSVCYAARMLTPKGGSAGEAAGRDGAYMGGAGYVTQAKFWLEGEAAEHFDLDYRVFNSSADWSDHVYSSSSEDAEWAGAYGRNARAVQVRLIRKPKGAKAVREFSYDNSFKPSDEYAGKYLTCAVQLGLNGIPKYGARKYPTDRYRGVVLTPAAMISGKATIRYYVDGEADPCFEDKALRHTPYAPPAEAYAAGAKEGCTRFDGWYTDPECTQPFAPGTVVADHADLYGRNVCTLSYQHTEKSYLKASSADTYCEEGLVTPAPASVLPAPQEYPYGTAVSLPSLPDYWSSITRKPRRISFDGCYANRSGNGTPLTVVRMTGDNTAFCQWTLLGFDGVTAK